MFDEIPITAEEKTRKRCNDLMSFFNQCSIDDTARFRSGWSNFWSRNLTQQEMQDQLDTLASHPATDTVDSTVNNALSGYFAKALREIRDITTENPSGLADARYDITGQCREFFTPGWTYTVEDSGRIVVIAPCEWVDS